MLVKSTSILQVNKSLHSQQSTETNVAYVVRKRHKNLQCFVHSKSFIRRALLSAHLSMTRVTAGERLRWADSRTIIASNLSSVMCALALVATLSTLENILSGSAVVTGRVTSICKSLWMFGMHSSEHLSSACSAVFTADATDLCGFPLLFPDFKLPFDLLFCHKSMKKLNRGLDLIEGSNVRWNQVTKR